MSQQFEIITVRPGDFEGQEALNRFLRGHAAISEEEELENRCYAEHERHDRRHLIANEFR